MSAGTRIRMPRGRRGAVATLIALLAVLVCAFGATEAISLAVHRRTVWFSVHQVTRFGRDTKLSDTVVLVVGIVVFAVGVLVLLSALVPPRRRLVELAETDRSVACGVSRRSLRRSLASAATNVDGVIAAHVSGRRRITVKATTRLRKTETLPDRVHSLVVDRLAQLHPAAAHTVRVTLDRKDN